MYGVYLGMSELDVPVLCADDGTYRDTEAFVVAVGWTSETNRILARKHVGNSFSYQLSNVSLTPLNLLEFIAVIFFVTFILIS